MLETILEWINTTVSDVVTDAMGLKVTANTMLGLQSYLDPRVRVLDNRGIGRMY